VTDEQQSQAHGRQADPAHLDSDLELLGTASTGALVATALFVLGTGVFATTRLASASATLGLIRLGRSGLCKCGEGERRQDSEGEYGFHDLE